jgi:hypothetical protein
MSQGKYAKYVFEGLQPSPVRCPQNEGKLVIPFIWGNMGNNYFPGSKVWVEVFQHYQPGGLAGGGEMAYLTTPEGIREYQRGVHKHPEDEVFFIMGTNTKDPLSLGGEYEFWLGAGEDAEKFIFTKNTCAYVPGGIFHNPHRLLRIDNPDHPVIVVVILLSPSHERNSEYAVDASGKYMFPPGWIPGKG